MTIANVQVCQDFIQGDTFIIKVSHVPVIDLTGSTFELTLKKEERGDSVLSVVFPHPGNGTDGTIDIEIPSTKTSLVPPGEYFASLKRTLSGGEAKTLVHTGKDNARKVEVFKNLKNT